MLLLPLFFFFFFFEKMGMDGYVWCREGEGEVFLGGGGGVACWNVRERKVRYKYRIGEGRGA